MLTPRQHVVGTGLVPNLTLSVVSARALLLLARVFIDHFLPMLQSLVPLHPLENRPADRPHRACPIATTS